MYKQYIYIYIYIYLHTSNKMNKLTPCVHVIIITRFNDIYDCTNANLVYGVSLKIKDENYNISVDW